MSTLKLSFPTSKLVAGLALVSLSPLHAQPTTSLDAERIDTVFRAFTSQTPGCALGIYRSGQTIYSKGYGMADLSHKVPNGPDTVFDIGSVSKQFTAFALLLLEQEGRLKLDDSLQQHLPELAQSFPQRITLRQLLQHTAGLRDYNELFALIGKAPEDVTSDADALRVIRAAPELNFAPGTSWSYSNTGFFLASQVAERVSGGTLDAMLQARVFGPLGMKDTHVRTDHRQVVDRRASPYAPVAASGEAQSTWRLASYNWNQAGDGAIQSTVKDLARWDAEMAAPSVLAPSLVQALRSPGQLNNGTPIAYALGQRVGHYRGLPRIHHGGTWGGFRAFVMHFPAQATGLAVSCNAANASPELLALRVADSVLEQAFPEPMSTASVSPESVPGLEAHRFVGAYLHAEGHKALRLSTEAGGELRMYIGFGSSPMRAASADALVNANGSLRLQLEDNDRALRLTRRSDPLHSERYLRLPAFVAKPQAAVSVLGRHRQKAIGARLELVLQGQELMVQSNDEVAGRRPVQWLGSDLLSSPGLVIQIERDAKGRAKAIIYTSERVRHLRFERDE